MIDFVNDIVEWNGDFVEEDFVESGFVGNFDERMNGNFCVL